VRRLRGLERAIGLTIVQPRMGAEGWEISGDGVFADPNLGASRLFEVYRAADETFTGRVTVPVLWDKQTGTIVNNESREILRMLGTVFTPIAEHPDVNFWTPELSDAIDAMIDANYETVNNGVYRSGFATSQCAYEEAAGAVFMRLDELDALLGTRRYLCGDRITEADWCLFATLVRFDPVYHGHFKCNLRRIRDYPNLSGYVRELYQVPGVRATVDFDHIQTHYYWSHESINPTRIVPIGGRDDLDAPHGRDAL
jgi:putative glutathione S-transferase